MMQGEEQGAMLLEEAQIDYKQVGETKFGSIKTVTPSGKVVRVPRPRITLRKEDGSDVKILNADGFGFYNFFMLNGSYSMTVEKEGYMPLKKYLYSAGRKEEYANGRERYMEDLFLYPLQEGNGNLEGKITDGPAGGGVSGMYLTLREGYDNTGGQAVVSAYTDAAGAYKLQDIPAGYYCVEFEDRDIERLAAGEGYEDNYFNIFIESGKDCRKNSYAYRRFEAQNTLELVVHWTKPIGVQQPSDTLTLYLLGRRGAYEMCLYNDSDKKVDGEIVAETFFNREFVPWDETKRMSSKAKIYDCSATSFMFYVANDRGGDYLSQTDAVAEVYYDGKLIQSFTLPKGDENYWEVCTYDAETGEFTPGGRLVDRDTFDKEAWDRLLWLAYGEEKPYEE